MSLTTTIAAIQKAVGAEEDGVFGPATAALVWRALHDPDDETRAIPGGEGIDPRSAGNFATLDAKVRPAFERFYSLATATAATLGCDYRAISGNRTWAEQDRLYERGRVTGGPRVTNARGGQSNHNFGIAADFGVFQGAVYLDDANPGLASKVHRACSVHARECGLEWGGSWKSIKDEPHYEVTTGLTLAEKRTRYLATGSVL